MEKKKLALAILLAILVLNVAPAIADDSWWNTDWHYRINVSASIGSSNENVTIRIEDVNFADILSTTFGSSETFSADSLRIIDSNQASLPLDFENSSATLGNVTWIANHSMTGSTNYFYYIYFDVVANGAKSQGEIMTNYTYWRSGHLDDTNSTSNDSASCIAAGGSNCANSVWAKDWANSLKVNYKWSTENNYDKVHLYVDDILQATQTGTGSAITNYEGNRTYIVYAADLFGNSTTTDDYGLYGGAVDKITFYPTDAVTTPTVTSGTTYEAQPAHINVTTDKSYYITEEIIQVSGSTWDDDNQAIDGTINITIYNSTSDTVYSDTTTTSSGAYSDAVTADFAGADTYTINVTYYDDNYANATNSTTFTYGFDTYPVLSNQAVTSSSNEWGENYTFTVDITDDNDDLVNISLYVLKSGVWEWVGDHSTTAPVTLDWNYSGFTCAEIGTVSYKFEYNDSVHALINSTTYSGPTLTANTVELIYSDGNNSIVNRSGSQTTDFEVLINDTTKEQLVDGYDVAFEVYDGSNWINFNNATSGSGTATISFNPDCSYSVGQTDWRASYGSTCYVHINSSNFTTTIQGNLSNSLESFGGATFTQGDDVVFNLTLTDDCSNIITGAEVVIDVGGVDNATMTEVGDGLYDYSWDSARKPVGTYSIIINSSKTYYNNETNLFSDWFEFFNGPPLFDVYSQNTSYIPQNESVFINVSITDQSDTNISQINFTILRPNGSIEQYNMSNITLGNITISNWTFTYPQEEEGTLARGVYYFNITPIDGSGGSATREENLTVYADMQVNISTLLSSYAREDIPSIKYNITDLQGTALQPQINFSVLSPDGNYLYLNNGDNRQTNSDGVLVPVVTFTIPSDSTAGSYIAISDAELYDSTAQYTISKQSNHTFSISASTSNEVHVDIDTTPFWYGSNTAKFYVTIYGGDGSLVAPDSIALTLFDPNEAATTLTAVSMGTGLYYATNLFSAPVTTTGQYRVEANVTVGSISTTEWATFRATNGGPFQFDIHAPTQGTIGSDMTFTINATNEGDAPAESIFQCWVQSGSTVLSENILEFNQEIQAGQNYVVSKTILVPISLTANTDYLLKCTLEIQGSNWQPSNASDSFTAVASTSTPTTPSTGGSGGGTGGISAPAVQDDAYYDLSILNMPDEVLLEQDVMKSLSFIVKNTGNASLSNIQLDVTGLPSDWTISDAKQIALLPVGEQKEFIFQIYVPKNARSEVHIATLHITSDQTSDETLIPMRVFATKGELINYQIEKLASKIYELKERAIKLNDKSRAEDILNILSSASLKLADAQSALASERYDEALININQATVMVQNAEDLLNAVEGPIKIFFGLLNWFTIVALSIIILILIVSILYSNRLIKTFNRLRKIRVVSLGKPTKKEIILQKSINILENQYKQGLLTVETYEELRAFKQRELEYIRHEKTRKHKQNKVSTRLKQSVYDLPGEWNNEK
jgi:hypothetical protein